MLCPACQRALENTFWARCSSCRLTWAQDVRLLPSGGCAPWPRDTRRVKVRWAFSAVFAWFVTLPIGLLGAAAAILSVQNVLRGASWLGWAGAGAGIPLGTVVAWGFLRPMLRWVLHVFAPGQVEVEDGAATVRLRGEDFVRSHVRFDPLAITSVRLSAGQGDELHVWLQHQSGAHVLVGAMPAEEARAFVLRLTG